MSSSSSITLAIAVISEPFGDQLCGGFCSCIGGCWVVVEVDVDVIGSIVVDSSVSFI